VTERRRRGREKLLDDMKEKRRFWKLKGETLYRSLWRTCYWRDCGPVLRQTREWMEVCTTLL